jgi:hypothetical protein
MVVHCMVVVIRDKRLENRARLSHPHHCIDLGIVGDISQAHQRQQSIDHPKMDEMDGESQDP